MNVVLRIPDSVVNRIAEGGDLERRALEALLLKEFRAGRLTGGELREALGLEALHDWDGFLKAHDVFEPYTLADLERERQTLARLGI